MMTILYPVHNNLYVNLTNRCPCRCTCLPPGSLFHSRETYNSLAAWLTDARTLASPNIVVILCGNKKDLDPEREVTFLEASRFAQENGEG